MNSDFLGAFSLQNVSPLKVLERIHNLDCSMTTGLIPPSGFIYCIPSEVWSPYLHNDISCLDNYWDGQLTLCWMITAQSIRIDSSSLTCFLWIIGTSTKTSFTYTNTLMNLRPLTHFAMFLLKLYLRRDYQKNNALLQSCFALTQTFKSSYFNRTVELWNSFPFRIPSINCFNSFNVSLSKHLLECFTSRFKVNDIYT